MQVRNINTFIPKVQVLPQFKGRMVDDNDGLIVSSSFRDEELYDPTLDYQDDVYRIYDYNDLPLYLPKQPLNIPKLYMQTYEMKDSRIFECDSSEYFNELQGIEVLDDTEYKDKSDGLSIADTLRLRERSYLLSKGGKKVFSNNLFQSLKTFAKIKPSVKQHLAQKVADVCVIKDFGEEAYFSKPIFEIVVNTCENSPQKIIPLQLAEINDFVSVAKLYDTQKGYYWDNKLLGMMVRFNSKLSHLTLKEKKTLIEACIVKDKDGNESFNLKAFDFAFEKGEGCSSIFVDALADAIRMGIGYDKNGKRIFAYEKTSTYYINNREKVMSEHNGVNHKDLDEE